MPIKLPATLPAYKTLAAEGVMVMDEDQAARQDIRPLRIALLNLMPKKKYSLWTGCIIKMTSIFKYFLNYLTIKDDNNITKNELFTN